MIKSLTLLDRKKKQYIDFRTLMAWLGVRCEEIFRMSEN